MDILTNKKYEQFDYINRYTNVPFYFNTVDKKEIFGLGSNMKKTSAYYSHLVKPNDTLDALSLKYYNNPIYWWVIAYFNDIQDSFVKLYGNYSVLKIPAIASIEFGDER